MFVSILCPRAHLSNPQSANSRARLYVLLSKCVLNESFRGCQIIGNSIQYYLMLLKIQTRDENGTFCRVVLFSMHYIGFWTTRGKNKTLRIKHCWLSLQNNQKPKSRKQNLEEKNEYSKEFNNKPQRANKCQQLNG